MVGTGSRLGMPFPKPLSPIPTSLGGRTALDLARHHLRDCEETYGIIHTDDRAAAWGDLDLVVRAGDRGTSTDTIRFIGRHFAAADAVAVVLPDIIWAEDEYSEAVRMAGDLLKDRDIVLILSPRQPGSTLDLAQWIDKGWRVFDKDISPEGGFGWHSFVARPAFLAGWDLDLWAPNINRGRIGVFHIEATAIDIGTPERYEQVWKP